jgi:hypothetical protein
MNGRTLPTCIRPAVSIVEMATPTPPCSNRPPTACYQNRSDQFIVAYYDSTGFTRRPAGANDQTNWAEYAESQVWYCVLPGSPFWPNRDANGQALIHLQAGQMYYMQLEHVQNGGGYDEGVTCKIGGAAGSVFTVSVRSNRRQHCRFRAVQANHLHRRSRRWAANYLHGRFARRTTPSTITNQVAIWSNGPSLYSPFNTRNNTRNNTRTNLFYRTSE